MIVPVSQIRRMIADVLYRASAPARFGLPSIDIDADDTNDAGKKAASVYARQHGVRGIDPFTIDVEIAKRASTHEMGVITQAFDALRAVAQGDHTWRPAGIAAITKTLKEHIDDPAAVDALIDLVGDMSGMSDDMDHLDDDSEDYEIILGEYVKASDELEEMFDALWRSRQTA